MNREQGDQFGKKDPIIYRCLGCHALLFGREIQDHKCCIQSIFEIAVARKNVAYYSIE